PGFVASHPNSHARHACGDIGGESVASWDGSTPSTPIWTLTTTPSPDHAWPRTTTWPWRTASPSWGDTITERTRIVRTGAGGLPSSVRAKREDFDRAWPQTGGFQDGPQGDARPSGCAHRAEPPRLARRERLESGATIACALDRHRQSASAHRLEVGHVQPHGL